VIHAKEKFSLIILIQINQSQLNWSSIGSWKRYCSYRIRLW